MHPAGMLESPPDSLFPEALAALRATRCCVERTDDALDLYRVNDGPELTTGGVIVLAFRLGLMVGDALVQ